MMAFKGTKLQLRAVRDINPEEEVCDNECSQHYGMRLVTSTVMSPLLFTIIFFYERYVLNVFFICCC